MVTRLLVLVAVAGVVVAVTATSREATPPPTATSAVASCSSAGCHGGGAAAERFSEQSTWASGDPHAKAYRVLFNNVSTTISRNLRRPVPAHQDNTCLACHAPDTQHAVDGVGCDACHGPSRDWLAKHYEPGWKRLSPADKLALGYRDNRDLVKRIEACAACHVGAADRDVDHDLIAAGHPRLAFEYTRFHYHPNYPRHWQEAVPERDFEVRAWFLGQVINFKAALTVTGRQADRAWPEYSGQSCYACHQGLKSKNRSEAGVAAWQAWNTALFEVLAEYAPAIFPGTPALPLERVLNVKRDAESPFATAALIAGYARTVPLELDLWLRTAQRVDHDQPSRTLTDSTLKNLAHAIAASGAKVADDWDATAPHYLALAALHHAAPKLFAPWTPTLDRLQKSIRYKPGYQSPADYQPEHVRALFDILKGMP
jgi:hypothetical protein